MLECDFVIVITATILMKVPGSCVKERVIFAFCFLKQSARKATLNSMFGKINLRNSTMSVRPSLMSMLVLSVEKLVQQLRFVNANVNYDDDDDDDEKMINDGELFLIILISDEFDSDDEDCWISEESWLEP